MNPVPFWRAAFAHLPPSVRFARLALLATLACLVMLSFARPARAGEKVNHIVLVHGAFVDASIWSDVIAILQSDGYVVAAVQLPLTSLDDDVHATREVLSHMDGPTVLVGYSWGGIPVTQVGVDPKVRGLVYFAALTPVVGESLADMLKPYPKMPGAAALFDGERDMLWIKPDMFAFALAHNAPEARTRVMAVTQKPTSKRVFNDAPTQIAWKTKPSWYVIATEDKIIPVALQYKLAARIGATRFELPTGHAIMLSQPQASARIIEQAAESLSAADK